MRAGRVPRLGRRRMRGSDHFLGECDRLQPVDPGIPADTESVICLSVSPSGLERRCVFHALMPFRAVRTGLVSFRRRPSHQARDMRPCVRGRQERRTEERSESTIESQNRLRTPPLPNPDVATSCVRTGQGRDPRQRSTRLRAILRRDGPHADQRPCPYGHATVVGRSSRGSSLR